MPWAGTARTKSAFRLVRLRPHILWLPCLCMAVCMALALMGVELGAQSAQRATRDQELSAVALAAGQLVADKALVSVPAMLLHKTISYAVNNGVNYTTIMNDWDAIAADCWLHAVAGTSLLGITPAGRFAATYPHTDNGNRLLGIDTLDPTGPYRLSGLLPLQTRNYSSTGPLPYQWDQGGTGYFATFNIPIYVEGASENDTFGIPWQPTDCPPGLCWNASSNVKWWGSVTLAMDPSQLTSFLGPIAALESDGYTFQIIRKGEPLLGEPLQMPVIPWPERSVPKNGVVKVTLGMWGQLEWTLCVWKESELQPAFQAPVQASVVIISVLLGVMLFAMLLSWEENRTLLTTCLPKEAIDRMRLETDWKAATHVAVNASLNLDTPAQKMLHVIEQTLLGHAPATRTLLSVRTALQKTVDVYRVEVEDLVLNVNFSRFSAEVRQALVAQLVGVSANEQLLAGDDPLCGDATLGRGSFPVSGDGEPWEVLALAERQSVSFTKPIFSTKLASADKACPRKSNSYGSEQFACPTKSGSHNSSMLAVEGIRSALFDVLRLDQNQDPLNRSPQPHQRPAMLSIVFEDAGADLDSIFERRALDAKLGPHAPLLDKVERAVLTAFNTWSFNAFELEEVTGGRPLSVLAYSLLHSTGLITWASIDKERLVSFLHRMEDGYASSPYHSARHAADVLQHFHMLVRWGGVMHGPVDHIALLACYLAAVVHDFEHRGRSNDFLVNTSDDLAITYSDRSPMEHHHLAAAWRLLKDPRYNFLTALSKPQWEKLRKTVIELVLSTDMKQHFAILGQFKSSSHEGGVSDSSLLSIQRSEAGSVNVHGVSGRICTLLETVGNPRSQAAPIPTLLCLQMALKCADLGHLAAPLNVHLLWVTALETEFFLQGDAERSLGLAISPLCDRFKEGVTKSQVGFFEFVCLPLFTAFTRHFKKTKPLMEAMQSNHRHWIADSAARQVIKLDPANSANIVSSTV